MRKLRLLSIAAVLALTLASPAFAGITDTMPGPEPAPSSSAQVNGITQCPPSDAATDPVVTATLEVLQIVLSVF